MKPLEGKVAVITGAGRLRGIGRAAAVALATDGADIVVTGTGRHPSTFPDDERAAGWRGIESTAAQVREQGRRCLTLTADAASAKDSERTAAGALAEFGRIDILVNNAAVGRGADRVPITELSEEIWRSVLEVKLTGSFLMCRAVLPSMIARGEGGSIINISSVAGKRGSPRTAAYNAANFGLQGLTQSLAMELAPAKIRVNAVCPGLTATSRMDGFRQQQDWDDYIRKVVPLGRAAEDHELGRYIAWLCGPDASYITGQSLNFDGGVVMW
jgi:3-oxoacyl-[acyl-carrier protein] reductase/meso-butanediol dehydrogenase/(S,S)-butanediol dehydrogenase/diacetyl reductase